MIIYAILYNAYEYDDVYQGELQPIYMSIDPKKTIEFFNKEISWYLNRSDVELDDKNSKSKFSCSVGNWCYNYKLISYHLDKDLRYVKK